MAEEAKPADNLAGRGDKAADESGDGKSMQAAEGSAPEAEGSRQPESGQPAESAQAKPGRRRAKYSHHTLFDIPIQGLTDAAAKAASAAAEEEEDEPEYQPGVARDALGVVSRVTYPDYSTREFLYSAGAVSEMVLRGRDGKITAKWFKIGDSYSEHRLEGGAATDSPGRIWRGSITVDNQSGDVLFQPKHSPMAITERAVDGVAYSENIRDGWAVSRSRDGRVGRVDYPGGGFRLFDYDPKGLAKITEGDGITYTQQIDGSWLKFDSRTNSSEICQERFVVNERGDLILVGPGYQVVERPDGTRIGCEADARGRLLVMVVSHPDEGEYQFGYDAEGRLGAIAWPDGTADARQGPARWRREPAGEDLDLDQQVDFDGNIIAISRDGVVEIVRPDGSARSEYPNGTREEHDRSGIMAWKMTPGQREIRFNAEAERYEYEIQEGETLSEICRDNLRANDGSARYEPTRDQVAKEIQRVQKLNGFSESSELQAGMKVALYEQAMARPSPDQS
jgi:YD repeat-containing protein